MQTMRRQNQHGRKWIAVVVLPYVVLLALVPPVGEFPTGDDFDYAASAWHLADRGHLRLSDWPAMTLVTHVAWGALFCKLAGSSFAVLRCAQFVMSLIAALAIYGGFLRRGHPPSLAALAAVCFAANPLTVSVQYTFLTDITGAAFSAVLIAAAPAMRERSAARLSAYSGLAGLAYLARETAAIPWMVLVALAAWDSLLRRGSWLRVVWLTGVAGLMVLGYEIWLQGFHGVPYNRSQRLLNWLAMVNDRQRPVQVLSGLGLLLAPLGIGILGWIRSTDHRRLVLLPVALGVAGMGAVCVGIDVAAPYRVEIFDLGLRAPESPIDRIPPSLRGPSVSIVGADVSLMRAGTTALSWLAAGALGLAVVRGRGRRDANVKPGSRPPLATWTCFGMAVLYAATREIPDRYLIGLIPPVLLMLAEQLEGQTVRTSTPAWIAGLLMACVSVVGIQDGMARSRSFWAATDQLLRQGIAPKDIDAGLAFGGMHRFNPIYRGEANRGPFWSKLPPGQWDETVAPINPLTTSNNRTYRVSFDDEPGYRRIEVVPFQSWLRSGEVGIYTRSD